MARLPGQQDTWLGYGHTVPADGPLAENTELCCMMLTMPYFFGNQASVCRLPGGNMINFYQLLPLYDNEMNYKLESDAGTLEDLFPDNFNMVVDINRPNVLSTKP